MDLQNSVGILTGASRGIGVHLALALADKGMHLALAARSADALEQTATAVTAKGVKAITVPTDVTNRADLEKLIERTTTELGPIDVLVNNAGVEMAGYFETLDLDRIEATIATNLTAAIMLTRLVVPGMLERGSGHIVNISSAAGKAARPYGTVYSASKHGLVGFSWGLRAELGPRGIGVSVVCPGYVTGEGMFAEREKSAGKVPAALKVVTPEKVAQQTVKAIERNRAEVIVGPPLMKTADVFHALSPDGAIWVGRRTGLYRFLKREATGE
ncbi:MAG: SDR family NAD(P)-dependent oxidoreductase [Actinomycetota bacterium]